VINK